MWDFRLFWSGPCIVVKLCVCGIFFFFLFFHGCDLLPYTINICCHKAICSAGKNDNCNLVVITCESLVNMVCVSWQKVICCQEFEHLWKKWQIKRHLTTSILALWDSYGLGITNKHIKENFFDATCIRHR